MKKSLLFTAIAFASSQSFAAGFQLIEQSVSAMGGAYAGSASMASDATTVFFNPAGMSRLKGNQISAGLHVISPKAGFSNDGSYLNPVLTGSTVVPGSLPGPDDDGGTLGVVPNFYLVSEINPDLHLGLGVNAPFGLATEYDSDWIGRYHAIKSEVMTVDINPSLSYRVNDRLSIGLGVSAQYLKAKLTNAVDFGTVCLGSFGAGACGGAGVAPLAADGKAEVDGDSWAFGYNLGLLYQFSEQTRLGFSYRSKISHDLDGDAEFSVPAGFQGLLNFVSSSAFTDTGASAEVDLPELAIISLFHQLTPKWSIMAEAAWTRWSRFEELRIQFDNPAQADSVQPENWDDSWRFSLGVNYAPNATWTYRAGVAYDQTPIPSAEDRTARIPGNSRTWLALGLGYNISQNLSLDVGYAHLFVKNTEIDHAASTGHVLLGDYDNSVDIFSAQLNWMF
ncbi:MAG: outer membrane protein transport protein [Chromatiaceae bacterium]|nr:outer membrane protein transport protein [Chromatiaceae bacterium]